MVYQETDKSKLEFVMLCVFSSVWSVQRRHDPQIQGLHGDEWGRALRCCQTLPLCRRSRERRSLDANTRVPHKAPCEWIYPEFTRKAIIHFLQLKNERLQLSPTAVLGFLVYYGLFFGQTCRFQSTLMYVVDWFCGPWRYPIFFSWKWWCLQAH